MIKGGFFLKHTHIKARVQKPYPIYDQNGQNQLKSIPYLWPKQLKNHTLWGCGYLYSPYKGVPPPEEVPARFHIALDRAFLLLLKGHFNNFHKRLSAITVHEPHTVTARTGKHCYCQIVKVFRISFLAFRSFFALSFYMFFLVSPRICLPTYDARNN